MAHPEASRRSVIKAAGFAIGGGFLSSAPAGAAPPAGEGANGPLWSGEYWARKGDVALAVYRKRLGSPGSDSRRRPVLFLVHGSSISARPSFDLAVPGHGEYSLMNVFAGHGYDVWTMDHEGYGKSSRTAGNADIASGVEDLKVASEIVARETGQAAFHFYGTSSGALRAGAFAMARPDRVGRLILSAFTWTGKGSPTLAKRREQLEYYRTHNRRPRDRAMIRSIFTRDKAGTADPAVAEALADAELQFGDTIPTGTYLDMTANLPLVDPTRIHSPVLLVRGEHDGIATEEDLFGFFTRLRSGDRQLVVIAGAAHSLGLGRDRSHLWHVMRSFLETPGH
jgi:alpha-beta hydrolase superfamily lysophospholipase